jgi:hypothetical protein
MQPPFLRGHGMICTTMQAVQVVLGLGQMLVGVVAIGLVLRGRHGAADQRDFRVGWRGRWPAGRCSGCWGWSGWSGRCNAEVVLMHPAPRAAAMPAVWACQAASSSAWTAAFAAC